MLSHRRRGSLRAECEAFVPGQRGLVGEARHLVGDHALASRIVGGTAPVFGEARIEVLLAALAEPVEAPVGRLRNPSDELGHLG